MKNKFVSILSIVFLTILGVNNSCAAAQREYKFTPVIDNKTRIEIARTLIPNDFNAKTDVIWERNFEQPALIYIKTNSNNEDVSFFYSSAKSFADSIQEKRTNDVNQQDNFLKVFKKNFYTPEQYVLYTINDLNPGVTDIKLEFEDKGSKELLDYLTGEMYQKIFQKETDVKTDKRASEIKITNPYIQPYIATYSYNIGEKSYKQTFITMFSSITFDYTSKTSYDKFETITKKLWTNNGFYSYRAEKDKYEKYLDDFIVFVSNSVINQKTKDTMELVKKEMNIELNPSYRDIYSGSSLKQLPSDLFKRYYIGGFPDYSEREDAKKPNLEEIRWLSWKLAPQKQYTYRKITNLWRQSIYIPQQYKYVYYNMFSGKLYISTENVKLKGKWTKLKPLLKN